MRPWRTAWHLAGLRECSESRYSLWRCDTIAERSELLSVREPVLRVGDPSLAQAHQPSQLLSEPSEIPKSFAICANGA